MSISTEYIIQRISPGEPSSDDVQYWLVNWNNGITGTQQYTAAASGSVLSETSLQYAPTAASAAVTVQAVAYSGLTLSALNQTFYFAPIAPTSVTASYGNAGTTATINWYDNSQIAADYLVQRELADSGWDTVQTVSAGSSTNTWTDPSLIAGLYGSGGGYIYRVIAQGPQITNGISPTQSGLTTLIAPTEPAQTGGTQIVIGSGSGTSEFGAGSGTPTVTAGGVAEIPVTVTDAYGNGESGVNLRLIGYDPLIMTPFETTVTTDTNGLAYIPVQGITAGATPVVVTDSGGDEGSATITTTTPSTDGDSQYQVSLPDTGFTPADGGADALVDNLTVNNPSVTAANPQAAVLQGIRGTVHDSTTNQTFVFPDPSHFYVEPSGTASAPLIVFTPISFTTTTITDLPTPPPTTSTTYTQTSTTQPVQLATLTVYRHDPETHNTAIAGTPGTPIDLYLPEQQNGTLFFTINANDSTGATTPAISWSITSTNNVGANLSGGTFTTKFIALSLSPGDNNFVLKAVEVTTAEIDIHVIDLTAATESSGNVPGADLAKSKQQVTGAYLPVDNVHENYGTATLSGGTIPTDLSTIPDFDLPKLSPAQIVPGNDDELMPITLHSLTGSAPGTYTLLFPSNFAIWQNQNLSGPVITGATFNATSPKTLWVEGIKPGSDYISVNWSNGALSLPQADRLKVTVFNWSGAQDVPVNGTYTYNASGAAKTSAWDTPVGAGQILTGAGTSNVAIQWLPGSPHAGTQAYVGEAVYDVNSDYEWQRDVNVIQVTVSAPTVGTAFTAGSPVELGLHEVNGTLLAEAGTGTPGFRPAGLDWGAKIILDGPSSIRGTNLGLTHITTGFVQNMVQYYNQGNYSAGAPLHSSISGVPTVAKPILDQFTNTGAWYLAGQGTFQPHSATNSSSTITANDTPFGFIPAFSDQKTSTTTANGSGYLVTWSYNGAFTLFVASETNDADNGSPNVYVPMAMATNASSGSLGWSFDASEVQGNTGPLGLKQSPASKVVPPSEWSDVPNGVIMTTVAPTMNTLEKTRTYVP